MKKLFVISLMFVLSPVLAYYDGEYSSDIPNACSADFPDTLYAVFSPIIYSENVSNACSADFPNTLYAVFSPIVYNGQYTENVSNACVAHFPDALFAVFTPITYHTCSAGYYLPANTSGCVICPNDSYCPGGTYAFNETVAQGITACALGTFAPEGMWEVAQCGRIFHVGDDVIYLRSVRKTVHALNFDMDMDGVADYFANMTPLSVPMHINSEHGLKILLDGIEYSVYDDTVDLGLYENNPFVPAQ